MRIVVDTNVVVSGLLWGGKALEILKAGTAGTVDLFTRAALLAELEEVLGRRKFVKYLAADQTSARQLVIQYANLATIVQPARIPPVVLTDPDDDAVIACAVAAAAGIVSGDRDLLNLKRYRGVEIATVAEWFERIRPH